MTMDIEVVIRDGTEGLPTVTLSPANGYRVIAGGLGFPGDERFRREYAESRFVPGAALVAARLEQQTAPLVVKIKGSTLAQLWARIDVLRNAVRQFHYTVDQTIARGADTVTDTYVCDPADTVLGSSGELDGDWLRTGKPAQVMTLSIPHAPQ